MHKKILVFVILVLVGWVNVEASSDDSLTIAELEKIIAECKDPLKVPPGIFKQIKTLQGVKPRPDFKRIRKIQDEGLVHVFVDSDIYPAIQTNFDQFISDLETDGYSVSVTQVATETPEDIRATLQSEYASGLVGVILVGDVPAAWMETFYYYASHFPTDYFYMDLDGTWNDYNADGFYDNMSGNLEPEIWSGRITPSNCIFGDEVTMLNQYFVKNHAYRTGSLTLPDRALGYLEITWYPEVETYLGWVYDDVTFVDDENTTTALHYKYMLQQGYEWVHLLSHSSPWGSTFFLHDETYGGGSVFSYEMPHVNPEAIFVLLNACSNAKYTETNNLGQSYLFGSDYVVAVIGETRIMYGDRFEDLYASLGDGKNLGESFLDWIWWCYDWFWGCHIFGDPTLKPHGHGNPLTLAGFSPKRIKKSVSEWDTSPIDVSPFTDGNPSACVDNSGNIWTAWNAGRDVRANIWTSHYDGVTWSEPEEVAFSVPWDFHPSMTTDNSGNVWIFWQSYREVEYSIDGWDIYGVYHNGSSWSSPIRITTADQYDVEPKSAVDSSGNVWVVWRTERKPDSDIMYSYYNGSSWSSNAYVTSSLDEERDPVITVDKDGNVWVVWYARKNGNWDLYAKYYNGVSWSTEIGVTDDPGYDIQPSVTADTSGWIWVLWRSNRDGNLDIYSKYYDGIIWSSDIPVTSDPGDDLCPSATHIGEDKILVTWQSNRDGDWNIYQSTYETEWSTPVPVSTDEGNQIQPASFHFGSNQFGSVFPGDQEENWNIYYSYTTAQWFAPAVNYGAGNNPKSVFCADLDGDSDLDLAVANYQSDNVSILKNNGNGTFETKVDYGAGDAPRSVFCADLDGDSDLDLAVACGNPFNNVSISKNNGDGTFQPKVDYSVGGDPYSVFCADLDGDSDLDLAVASQYTDKVSILKNNGDGTFQTKVDYAAGDGPLSIFCADLDGDSDLDLAVANWVGDNVSIFKNNGDGIFQTKVDYDVGNDARSVFCADLDGDSDLDLAVANHGAHNISILKNIGDGSFQDRVNYSVGLNPRSIFCVDLDGDSDLDLAVSEWNGGVSILKNNGDGTFQAAVNYEAGYTPSSIFCADLDADLDLDLAVANSFRDSVSILMNLTQVPGNSPPYPFPLLSPADEDTTSSVVEFHWAKTQDVNLSDQIRYDLYIMHTFFSSSDSETVVHSDLVKNTFTDTLDIGRYHWRVMAKDNWGAETWSEQTWHFIYFIRGDVNGDETVDLGDVVMLINYLYRGGIPPDPLASGDVNCDYTVDLGDIVYLINYLYRDGPPPCS